MRAYQFIFEYRRDKTAEALADKLIFALQQSKSAFIQDSLQGPRTLLGMIRSPKIYPEKPILMSIFGKAAACRYGRGTRWCTAATTGVNYFGRYHRDGPLYILIPKNPQNEGEKYQLHFPSEQFMNEEDDPVSLDEIIENRFPGLSSFFFEREPEYFKNNIYYASDETLSEFAKVIGEAVTELGYRLYDEIEQNDDYYHSWVIEEAEKLGYVDENGEVDWDKVHNDPDLSYNEYNDEARKLLSTIEEVKNLSASALRKYIRDYNEPEVDGSSYQVLEIIYPKIIYYERNSNYDKDFGEAVKNDLFIRLYAQNLGNMLRNMQEIGKVGVWTIGIRK